MAGVCDLPRGLVMKENGGQRSVGPTLDRRTDESFREPGEAFRFEFSILDTLLEL